MPDIDRANAITDRRRMKTFLRFPDGSEQLVDDATAAEIDRRMTLRLPLMRFVFDNVEYHVASVSTLPEGLPHEPRRSVVLELVGGGPS